MKHHAERSGRAADAAHPPDARGRPGEGEVQSLRRGPLVQVQVRQRPSVWTEVPDIDARGEEDGAQRVEEGLGRLVGL